MISRAGRDQRGFAMSVEAVIIVPALLMLIFLVVVAARFATASTAVEATAGSAARAATLARSATQAQGQASAATRANLASAGLRCSDIAVRTDTAGFAVAAGRPAWVRVTVSCTLDASDIGIPVGAITVERTGTAALDRYRERQ